MLYQKKLGASSWLGESSCILQIARSALLNFENDEVMGQAMVGTESEFTLMNFLERCFLMPRKIW
jgi:hypothetical protein